MTERGGGGGGRKKSFRTGVGRRSPEDSSKHTNVASILEGKKMAGVSSEKKMSGFASPDQSRSMIDGLVGRSVSYIANEKTFAE